MCSPCQVWREQQVTSKPEVMVAQPDGLCMDPADVKEVVQRHVRFSRSVQTRLAERRGHRAGVPRRSGELPQLTSDCQGHQSAIVLTSGRHEHGGRSVLSAAGARLAGPPRVEVARRRRHSRYRRGKRADSPWLSAGPLSWDQADRVDVADREPLAVITLPGEMNAQRPLRVPR